MRRESSIPVPSRNWNPSRQIHPSAQSDGDVAAPRTVARLAARFLRPVLVDRVGLGVAATGRLCRRQRISRRDGTFPMFCRFALSLCINWGPWADVGMAALQASRSNSLVARPRNRWRPPAPWRLCIACSKSVRSRRPSHRWMAGLRRVPGPGKQFSLLDTRPKTTPSEIGTNGLLDHIRQLAWPTS